MFSDQKVRAPTHVGKTHKCGDSNGIRARLHSVCGERSRVFVLGRKQRACKEMGQAPLGLSCGMKPQEAEQLELHQKLRCKVC